MGSQTDSHFNWGIAVSRDPLKPNIQIMPLLSIPGWPSWIEPNPFPEMRQLAVWNPSAPSACKRSPRAGGDLGLLELSHCDRAGVACHLLVGAEFAERPVGEPVTL